MARGGIDPKTDGGASGPLVRRDAGMAAIATGVEDGAPARPSQRAGAHVDVPDDKAWLTAAEAAVEALPGWSYSKSQINRLITDAGIKCRNRNARGGGREFHWTSLPREAREEYLRRHGRAVGLPMLATVSPAARETEKDLRAETRRKIADAAAAYVLRSKRGKGAALEAFAELYRHRRVRGLEEMDYQLEPSVTPAQVREWDRVIRNHGIGALIDGRGRKKGSGFFHRDENKEARIYVTAMLAKHQKITAGELCGDLERELGIPVALRTMQAYLAALRSRDPGLLKATHNPDKHRSHHRPAFGSRSENILRLNQLWELDATRADAMCLLPDGSQRRVALTAVIDVYSRRAMVLVSDQPRAVATMALLRRAVMTWGVPEILKTDNGKEFSNRDVLAFCGGVGITISYSRPFHPEEKPHIERFFGSLNRSLFPALPGFVGHSIVDRTAIRSRASFAHRFGDEARLLFDTELSPHGLQARLDAWCRDYYETRPHSGLKGQTPCNVALLQADQVKRLTDMRALDQLLLPIAGTRVVLKKGISVNGRFFIAEELGAIMGQRVLVRHDPHDPSRIMVYRSHDETFLCMAVDPELSGHSRMQIAIGAQKEQRRVLNAAREAVRNVHRLHPPGSLADRRLAHLQGDGFALDPAAEQALDAAVNPRLIAAARAADASEAHGQPEQPIEPTAEEHEAAAAILAEITPVRAPAMVRCEGYERPLFERDTDFWRWAQAHMEAGAILDAQDSEELARLIKSPAFQKQLAAEGSEPIMSKKGT